MLIRPVYKLAVFLAASFVAFMPRSAATDETLKEKCSSLLHRDKTYSARTAPDEQNQGPRFAVPGGPIDQLITEAVSGLDTKFVDRLGTGFVIEMITHCRKNPNHSVSSAILQSQKTLRLNAASPNWGMKEIDTDELLHRTCEAFVLYVQEFGIGEMFYNDPVRVTFDAYWTKFDLGENDYPKISSIESDAQFACSLEPETIFINVLDRVAADYQLRRVR